jgi:hypothetical protein
MRGRHPSIVEEIPTTPDSAPTGCELLIGNEVSGNSSIEQALTLVLRRAAAGYGTRGRWETRVRAALAGLLDLFDEQPDLARLCVVGSQSTDPQDSGARQQTLRVFTRRLDDGRHHASPEPPPHAADAVLAGAIGAIHARLLEPDSTSVSDLLDSLMSFIVLPYRGAAAARAEGSGHRTGASGRKWPGS